MAAIGIRGHVLLRLSMVIYLCYSGCELMAVNGICSTCNAAAFNGHLSMLQWLHANGFDLTSEACASAAENGYLSVSQWLRTNGCD